MSIGKNNNPSSALSVAARALTLAACGILPSACERQLTNAEQSLRVSSEPVPKTPLGTDIPRASALDGLATDAAPPGEDGINVELRRGYGAIDMRFHACVSRPNDSTLHGEGCPSAFVIYGPYVPVPANSEIEVSFEVKASKKVEIYADIVSQMGTQTLAGLSRIKIEAGMNPKLGYRVHVFNADVNVESRIGLAADPGTTFEFTNLTMTVR